MQYLNIIYFLILTAYGYRFLTSDGKVLKSASMEGAKFHYNGPELFWCLTFATGVVALSASVGLDLMAVRLGVLELFCVIGLRYAKSPAVFSTPLKIYMAYLIWLIIGCFYSPAPGYGIRVFLKYLYPLLLPLFASAAVRDGEVFLKSSIFARGVSLIAMVYAFVPFLHFIFPSFFWDGTAMAINFISMMIFSLGMFFYSNEKKKNIILAAIFILPCFIWTLRTSIMGSFMALIVFSIFKYKLKSLPVIAGFLLLFVTLIFAIPSVRDKMFYHPNNKNKEMLYEGELSRDDIDSNGRFAMWDWSLAKFYEPKKLTGSGTGNLQYVFYETQHPFLPIKIIHNDYVQILCDNGLIGIILIGGSFLLIIGHCFIVFNNKKYSTAIRLAAITAGASLAGMMLTMYSDNVINYSMSTLSMPLGFYGMMLGMKHKADYGI